MDKEKKYKDIRSEVIAFNGDTITLKLHDEIDVEKIQELAVKGRYFTYLDFYEKDTITNLQRSHFYALVGDIFEYTGIPKEIVEDELKFKFMYEFRLDESPSLKRGAMKKSAASELIDFTITFCIQNGIPFRKQQFYLTTDVSKMLYAMTMRRLCWVCGVENSEIHHATNLVGMGNDRNKHNHLKSKFMCLCVGGNDIEDETKMASHHDEVHKLGLTNFMNKYHVRPIKLSEKDLKKLGLRGDYTK